MKKGTKIAALLLGLALVIPACTVNNSSKTPDQSNAASEATPSSEQGDQSSDSGKSSEDPVNYTVTISNKEALQAEWFAGDQSRKVEISVEPKANVAQLVNEGVIQISSSNAEILSITGQMASPLAAGEATITVKCGESQDTVSVTLKAQQTVKEKYGVAHEGTEADPFTNEDACKVAKAENYNNEDFYVQGKVASFYHLPGSRTDGAVSFFLEPATAGGEKFEVYKCYKSTGTGEASYLTDDDIWVGGIALAHGTFTTYGEQAETTGAKLIKCEGNKPQPRQTLTKTFAEVLEVGAALADGDATWDYYKFQGYVTKVVGNDFYLTATKGEALVSGKSDANHGSRDIYTNAIELYGAGSVADLAAILLNGAKVEVTMIVKNYHGTIENGLNLTKDDVTLVEAGQPWSIPTIKKTVAEALTIINGLEDNKTTEDVYEIEGYIVKVTTAWSAQYSNISFTLGAAADAGDDAVITVFRAKAAEGTDGSKLKAGDKVKVVGQLQKYVKDSAITPELVSSEATLLEAAGGDTPAPAKKTVAEALAIINALEDNKTTTEQYEIEGYIVKVTTAWNTQYNNVSFTLGAAADAGDDAVITVFRSGAATGTDGSALKAGDKVQVVGNLQKYVKDSKVTPELTSGSTKLLEAASGGEGGGSGEQQGTTFVVDFSAKTANHNAYGDTWTYGDVTVSGGANNNGGWTFVKMGGKSATISAASYPGTWIKTNKAIAYSVASVTFKFVGKCYNQDNEKATVKVESYSDAALATKVAETPAQEVPAITTNEGVEEVTFTFAAAQAANLYYKINFDILNTTTYNGVVALEKITFNPVA